jgi:hypothetical protein
MMQFSDGKMPVLSKVWGHFTVSDETGVCEICRKDIKLSKCKSTGHLWRHLKQDHRLEYENLRKGGENNNRKSSTPSTKKYAETEHETQNTDTQRTKWLEFNQMDDCVTGVKNMDREGDKSIGRTSEGDTAMSDSSADEMEFDEECDEDGNNCRVRLGNKTKSCEMTAEGARRIEDMMEFVEKINGMSEKNRALGLKNVSNPSIKNISEICLNILNGNVTTEPKFVEQIRCHKDIIRKIGSKSSSLKSKKHFLASRGGIKMINTILPRVKNKLERCCGILRGNVKSY